MKVELYTKDYSGDDEVFKVQTEGNEVGVAALLTEQTPGRYYVNQACDARLTVNDEELRTIWFALKEYYANLQTSLDKYKEETPDQSNVEDLAFTHEQMHAVAKMMFMISTNHDQSMRKLMTHFLDV